MHWYRIVAQVFFILSILDIVLATPIVVQDIVHEARVDDTVVAEDVPAIPNEPEDLDAPSDQPTSPTPTPTPDAMEAPSDRPTPSTPPSDVMASPQHSSLSDGSTSSGYPIPHLSSDSSDSGYSWMLDRTPRLSPHPPASLHLSISPSPSGSGSSEIMSFISTPAWLQMLEQVPSPSWQYTESDLVTTETNSLADLFTPSHPPSSSLTLTDPVSVHSDELMSTPFASASSGSLSSHYFTASDGLPPISEASESPSSPPENAKFFNENMMKKLKIAAGVTIIGGIIAGIVGSQIKHQHSDYRGS